MYDDVYRGMVKSRIAIELDNEVWVNKQGLIVESETESFGRKTKFLLTRSNYLIFVDETGDDTSQKHDGNQGREKFVVGVKERALLSSSFDGCHWTSLGFTLGDGRPLLCVIIIACSISSSTSTASTFLIARKLSPSCCWMAMVPGSAYAS
mmetsp:Transcript_8800/g.12807  ORF Transcript_8800/g.12807 Transcript_8800/m.12807 type:complete len:151 (+) Transcript_8800:1051-1503(+)